MKFDSSFIFREYPSLEYFSWTQFTPYTIDSDFLVNFDDLHVCFSEGSEELLGKNKLISISCEIKTFLTKFDKEFYKSQFGDHAEIKINKECILINEYDHD